jgi:hypothetical protein
MGKVINPDFHKKRHPLDLEDVRLVASPATKASDHPHRLNEPFVLVPLAALKIATAAFERRAPFVWLFLVNTARLRGTDTVTVTNAALARWGISRSAKYAALEQLEAAGLIAVEKRIGANPVVRLLRLSGEPGRVGNGT